jgi:hypothetical protein
LGVPMFSVHMFTIVISTWRIVYFSNMKWFYLSFLINFEICFVRYEYSCSCLLSGSIYLEFFFHSFTLSLCLSLPLKCVSYRQQIVGSCFINQTISLSLLIVEFKLFTFRVIIIRYELFAIILLSLYYLILS